LIKSPQIKVLVANEYLTAGVQSGFSEAYMMGLDCRNSSYIRFTVYLESGAVFSNLPIEAIYCDKFDDEVKKGKFKTEQLQPYSCLDGTVSWLIYDLIKNAEVKVLNLGLANYLFTINYQGDGISEDPEQYKTHNIVALSNGQLAAVPNNFMIVKDNWFSTGKTLKYSRVKKHYFAGG
jgi:hypothetical protein